MDFIQVLVLVLIVVVLTAFLVLGSVLNKRTPLPEGCEITVLGCASCTHGGCSMSGASRQAEDLKAEIQKDLIDSREKVE